jgi:perosamine synthetase
MEINQIEPYISEREAVAVQEYLNSGGWLTEFKKTQEFEQRIAEYVGAKYASVVPSGTVALYLSLLSTGIGHGDIVAVPNYTMIATINAVKWTGAEPLICDIDPTTMCIDINNLKESVNTLKAIIHVSINGRSGDMYDVVNFCKNNCIILIEDSAQAMGSQFDNKFLGTFGDLGVYSLTPHKIITTGQGGVIVTNDIEYFDRIKSLKDFSRVKPGVDIHNGIGYNFKFTDLQSVVGIEQIKTINYRVNRKKELFSIYYNRLKHMNQIQFLETDLTQVTPWAIDVIFESEESRNGIAKYLLSEGIGTRIFYPALNSQAPYSYFKQGSFPESESIVNRGLWLPSSISLSDKDVIFICNKIISYFG